MRISLSEYCLNYQRCINLLRAVNRCIALVLIGLCLVAVVVIISGRAAAAATWFGKGATATATAAAAATGGGERHHSINQAGPIRKSSNTSSLYECELSYLQMDLSLIKFSINYLEFDEPRDKDDNEPETFRLARIDYNTTLEELATKTKLDARLPFVFFINGFNTFAPYEEINATWMYEVARSFAKRSSNPKPERSAKPAKVMEPIASGRHEWGLFSRIQRFIGEKVLAGRVAFWSSRSGDEKAAGVTKQQKSNKVHFEEGRNVIFLTWSIPDLFASNLFAMIPAYYKTVANYDLIVDYVSGTILKFIELVERTNEFETEEARANYYKKFQFYGHSLGSHILSDAISQVVGELAEASSAVTVAGNRGPPAATRRPFGLPIVRLPTKPMKFGKLMGLDPASPCFVSLEYGISSSKVSEAVEEVVVLHSNAGFAGIPNERANLEVVLNGGTFQPGCVWYDFTCSHVRSTDILSYIDDECQMVAYRCTSYNHFKQGACETCPSSSADADADRTTTTSSLLERNCILVNLPEQHRDKPQVLAYAELLSNRTRQLAAATTTEPGSLSPKQLQWLTESLLSSQQNTKLVQKLSSPNGTSTIGEASDAANETKSRKAYFHYVNTNANFRFGRKSHCLQHYQLRLLIYNEDLSLREKCKLSSFYIKSNDEIKLKLFYETAQGNVGQPHNPYLMGGRQAEAQLEDGDLPMNDQTRTGSGRQLVAKMFRDHDDPRIMSDQIKLGAVIKDVFHTALVNFEDSAKLFVGAQVENIDLLAMAQCYKRANATSGPNFVLDTAFMSHTNEKIRNAYSSVLCGQLALPMALAKEPEGSRSNDSGASSSSLNHKLPASEQTDLMLNLCKQSELKNVSAEIDKLLNQIKLHLLDETWKVSLLNSLFSLFTEWEPF